MIAFSLRTIGFALIWSVPWLCFFGLLALSARAYRNGFHDGFRNGYRAHSEDEDERIGSIR